jgi:hypothetical protein
MATTRPKSDPVRPWHKYRGQPGDLHPKLLGPGWGGHLDPDELAYIVEHLERDSDLRRWWGMKASWRRIPEQVVLRIAMEGDPDDQGKNRQLARPRQHRAEAA